MMRSTQAGPEFGSQRSTFLRLAFSTLVGNGPMKLIMFKYLFFLSLYASFSVRFLTKSSLTKAARNT